MSTSRTALRITICGIPELGEHSAAGVTHVGRGGRTAASARPSARLAPVVAAVMD